MEAEKSVRLLKMMGRVECLQGRWLDCGCIFKVEPEDLLIDERHRLIKDLSNNFDLSN